jgi:formyltetrahydrofolate-dependent phosphoribosylglycinamide formyltransferase
VSLRLAVFASGGGSNLQGLLDRFNARAGGNPIRVVLVVSDREDAGALEKARRANVDAVVIPVAGRPIDYVARELLATLESADVDLIALAGYLRLIPPAVVRTFRNRIVNIHPALLPAFGGKGMFGLRVHRAVLAAGCTVSGATVHLVNEEYDQGQIVAQWPVPVLPNDTAEGLAHRVLQVEHLLYPTAIEAVANALSRGETVERFGANTEASFQFQPRERPSAGDVRRALGLEE